jgi:simple sugar transport system permease protein
MEATLRIATPLIFAAIGTTFSERSGVMNIGVEGMMLLGAFSAVAISYYTNDAWLGLLAAIFVGAFFGLLLAWSSISLKFNQIVAGVAINLLGVGIPNYLLIALWNKPGFSPLVDSLSPIEIPLLSNLPIIGSLFSSQNILTYLALLLSIIAQIILFKTPLGLRIRSVGEHPLAADTAGINVYALRYSCVIFSGLMAGLAGASLSIGQLSFFSKQMTQGRGFIALGAMIFGKWTPLGSLGASLLFGFADALQFSLQAIGVPIPSNLLMATPYVLTLIVLAGFVGVAKAPAAVGRPYLKGESQ